MVPIIKPITRMKQIPGLPAMPLSNLQLTLALTLRSLSGGKPLQILDEHGNPLVVIIPAKDYSPK